MILLGERIQALRKQRGLSQEQLAEQIGVSRQAVSKWEVDDAVPEVEKLVALARVFGVSTDELLGCEPPMGRTESQIRDGGNWLADLLRRRGYRAGYVVMGWGIFVLLAAGLVGFVWYWQIAGPLRSFEMPLSELPVSVWAPMLFLGFLLLLGLAATIGGLVAAVRGRRRQKGADSRADR